MLETIETNKQNSSNTFIYDNDIYGILLKTGQYIKAINIIYLNILLFFLIKII